MLVLGLDMSLRTAQTEVLGLGNEGQVLGVAFGLVLGLEISIVPTLHTCG